MGEFIGGNKGKLCDKSTSIYICCDPVTHEPRYVGKTVKSVKSRIKAHVASSNKRECYSARWFRKVKNPYYFIVEIVPPYGDWIEAEQFWIAYMKSLGARLTNHTIGGEGMTGYVLPPEHRDKISKANKGQIRGPHTEEYKLMLSNLVKGIKKPTRTAEHAAKIGAKLKGTSRIFSDEHCANLSKSQIGRGKDVPLTESHKLAISESLKGRIFSEQALANMKAGQIGVKRGKQSEETIAKRVASREGYSHSEETLKKIRDSHTGKKLTDEHVAKIAIASANRSPETILKMSQSQQARFARERAERERLFLEQCPIEKAIKWVENE